MGRPRHTRTARPAPRPSGPAAPRRLTRRGFLGTSARGVGVAALASSVGLPGIARAQTAAGPFRHGVASGDPLPDGVVIWTRVTPSDDATPGSGLGPGVTLVWQVSTSPAFFTRAAQGTVTASALHDHTVRVDVTGLQPGRPYYYRFLLDGTSSRVGRTRTAPAAASDVASVRFALASCANYEAGYFPAYRQMALRNDLDFVLHVGDYIYEYASGNFGGGSNFGRIHDPITETISLSDYRRRYAHYRVDPDLQALHARHPFVCTWDDHEVANDAWATGAQNHQPASEGSFAARRAAAYQAYFEWMPIRRPSPDADPTRLYRRLQFGTLVDLALLDLRQYRDAQPADSFDPSRDDPDRVLLGREQLDWLEAHLASGGATWRLLGNSVMVSPITFPTFEPAVRQAIDAVVRVPFNFDSWDGYTDDRAELLALVDSAPVRNVVFLTGDIHTSWACEVPRDQDAYLTGAPPSAVEIVGTSITSDNLDDFLGARPRSGLSLAAEAALRSTNPHVKLVELDSHGYTVVDVTPERLQADWYYVSTRRNRWASQRFGAGIVVANGTSRLTAAAGPLGPRA